MEMTIWGFRPTFRVKVRGQGVIWGQGSCQVHTGCPSTKKWRYFCFGAHVNRLCCSHQTRNATISCDQRAPDRKPNKGNKVRNPGNFQNKSILKIKWGNQHCGSIFCVFIYLSVSTQSERDERRAHTHTHINTQREK